MGTENQSSSSHPPWCANSPFTTPRVGRSGVVSAQGAAVVVVVVETVVQESGE